jgi:hypothetical protein
MSMLRWTVVGLLLWPVLSSADDIYYAVNNKIFKSASTAVSIPVPKTFIPIELEQVKWGKYIIIKSDDNSIRKMAFDDIVSLQVASLTFDEFSKLFVNNGTVFLRTGESAVVKTFSTQDDFENAVQVTAFPKSDKICSLSIPSPRSFAGSECTVINVKNPSDTQSFRVNYMTADTIDAMSWINSDKVLCVSNSLRGNSACIIDVGGKSSSPLYIKGDYFTVQDGKLQVLRKSDSGPYHVEIVNP